MKDWNAAPPLEVFVERYLRMVGRMLGVHLAAIIKKEKRAVGKKIGSNWPGFRFSDI